MKLSVLAVDYDGTSARNGVMDAGVRRAIEEARRHGIILIKDNSLASQIREVESQYAIGQVPDVNDALIRLVHERYTLSLRRPGE